MANARRDSKSRTDRDGVRITTTRRRSPLVPAVLPAYLMGVTGSAAGSTSVVSTVFVPFVACCSKD